MSKGRQSTDNIGFPSKIDDGERDDRCDSGAEIMSLARQAVVKAQINHIRVRRMGRSLRRREARLVEAERRWTLLARKVSSGDEQKSLDCLGNRVRCRVRLTNVRERLLIHEALESELYLRWKQAEGWLEKLEESAVGTVAHDKATGALQAMLKSGVGSDLKN